jgi:hypothetical protein
MGAVLRGRYGSAALSAAAVALVFACGDALQQDELDCEEAVSYLEGCCPGFDTRGLRCVDDGCGGQVPDISEQQSACIRAESCQELVANGVCQRVQPAAAASSDQAPSQVCP